MVVYRRRGGFRKRRQIGAPRVPKEITWGQFATKAWSGVQQIRKLINVEEHRFDTAIGSAIAVGGNVVHLSAVDIGDAQSQRTGSSILCKGMHCRVVVLKNTAATQTVVRLMLIKDKQQVSDTSPTIAQVLDTANVVSHVSPDFTDRFAILRDFTYSFDTVGVGAIKNFDFKVDLSGTHINYNGATGADIQKNGLYWIQIANEAVNAPTISFISRLTFYDN